MPTYPLYTAVLAKLGAKALYYRLDHTREWMPDFDHLRNLVTANTRALVVIDPNNPTGAVYSRAVRLALLEFADRHGLMILADEVYGDLGFEGSVEPLGLLDPDAPIISYSSLSKAYLAPGWRTGWMAIGRSPRLDDVVTAVKKLADGRLCSTVPMQYAVAEALNGDRSHQMTFREALKARARLTVDRLRAMPGVSCVPPRAAFYAMPKVTLPPGKTDEDYVLALLARHPRHLPLHRRRDRVDRAARRAAAHGAGVVVVGARADGVQPASDVADRAPPADAPRHAGAGGRERAERHRHERGRHRPGRDLHAHRRRVRAHYDSHSQLLFPDRSRGDGRLLRSLRAGGAARRRGDRGARSGG